MYNIVGYTPFSTTPQKSPHFNGYLNSTQAEIKSATKIAQKYREDFISGSKINHGKHPLLPQGFAQEVLKAKLNPGSLAATIRYALARESQIDKAFLAPPLDLYRLDPEWRTTPQNSPQPEASSSRQADSGIAPSYSPSVATPLESPNPPSVRPARRSPYAASSDWLEVPDSELGKPGVVGQVRDKNITMSGGGLPLFMLAAMEASRNVRFGVPTGKVTTKLGTISHGAKHSHLREYLKKGGDINLVDNINHHSLAWAGENPKATAEDTGKLLAIYGERQDELVLAQVDASGNKSPLLDKLHKKPTSWHLLQTANAANSYAQATKDLKKEEAEKKRDVLLDAWPWVREQEGSPSLMVKLKHKLPNTGTPDPNASDGVMARTETPAIASSPQPRAAAGSDAPLSERQASEHTSSRRPSLTRNALLTHSATFQTPVRPPQRLNLTPKNTDAHPHSTTSTSPDVVMAGTQPASLSIGSGSQQSRRRVASHRSSQRQALQHSRQTSEHSSPRLESQPSVTSTRKRRDPPSSELSTPASSKRRQTASRVASNFNDLTLEYPNRITPQTPSTFLGSLHDSRHSSPSSGSEPEDLEITELDKRALKVAQEKNTDDFIARDLRRLDKAVKENTSISKPTHRKFRVLSRPEIHSSGLSLEERTNVREVSKKLLRRGTNAGHSRTTPH